MTLTVSNSLTGEQEPFEPVDSEEVTLYYCGLTVSDDAHLGHARSWIHTDVMHRWLEFSGYTVRHVENFTDVNEKIVARIGECGTDERNVARHFIDRVLTDMRSLNLKRVSVYPRVTEHVPEIISMIERLIERGHAYEANGSVYFDVASFDAYGQLSNPDVEMMEGQEPEASEKRRAADFALWKAGGVDPETVEEHRQSDDVRASEAASGAITYESPWGEGRPGWHIECSAMATTHLGETFDLHVAGRDIKFPHNENEIAQSVAATDAEYARYWLHTGLLRTEGEKMSSSLKNYFRVRDAVDRFGSNVLRVFFLSSVYHADQAFSSEAIAEAEERWDRLHGAHRRVNEVLDSADTGTKSVDSGLREAVSTARAGVETAMNDDFNTREALAALLECVGAMNTHLDREPPYDYQGLQAAIELLESIGGNVFGFSFDSQSPTGTAHLADSLVELLIAIRADERAAGNYDRADSIRDDLQSLGVRIEDTDDGVSYWFDTE